VDVKAVPPAGKETRILSVGRFAVGGHSKKQIEMLNAFGELRKAGAGNWTYDCVGALGASESEAAFFEEARALAAIHHAHVSANLDRAQLRELYQRASIFWHATGMGVNEQLYPEQAEHFGITTVEAMAAGCVPVVINKGAQPEIVEHGISGFLWNTLEELQDYTSRLQEDGTLLRKMSSAAQARAQKFSREEFINQFKVILKSNNVRSSYCELA
jgi:glycosyltransferase involved in cell wall biosynthesis